MSPAEFIELLFGPNYCPCCGESKKPAESYCPDCLNELGFEWQIPETKCFVL
jgi:hypothetical protein